MHYSAYNNAQRFYYKYCEQNIENKKVLDVGSYDVNGTMKPIFERAQYIGLDMEGGPNVDVVGSSHEIPFKDNYFDIVISSSCFEHDDMFWVSFNEMCRVIKPGGLLYIQAPQNGPYHGWPGDNWRFYADSWKALEKWGRKSGYEISLIESYIDETTPAPDYEGHRIWNDSVGIYRKRDEEVKFDLKSIEVGHHNIKYRGVKTLKCPFDYVTYQMIINQIKPDLIIEIGTHYGGNAFYLADILSLINDNGELHTIDIDEYDGVEILDKHPRIKRFLGGFENYDLSNTKGSSKILVIDDGSHVYEDVLKSLIRFKDVVSVDSYFIVEDGILNELGYSDRYNGGPLRAINEFLENNDQYVIDRTWCDFFGRNATFNPNGFLKRVK
jgi:cephalosporin hydroxylase